MKRKNNKQFKYFFHFCVSFNPLKHRHKGIESKQIYSFPTQVYLILCQKNYRIDLIPVPPKEYANSTMYICCGTQNQRTTKSMTSKYKCHTEATNKQEIPLSHFFRTHSLGRCCWWLLFSGRVEHRTALPLCLIY